MYAFTKLFSFNLKISVSVHALKSLQLAKLIKANA